MPETNAAGDDILLILRVKRDGDVHAYRHLYDRYASSVLGFSYRIVGHRGLAEEITQETFWRVWQNASSYDEEKGSFANWIFGIARNLSIDSVRRQQKFTEQPLFDDKDYDPAGEQALIADDQDIADEAWLLVQREQVHQALEQLPSEQRDVIQWIYFEGKTRREIAAEQDIPFGTINTRARLALQKLQHFFTFQGIGE